MKKLLPLCVLYGCNSNPYTSPPILHRILQTPVSLIPTATFLDWLIPLGIAGIIIGLVIYFCIPEFPHKSSMMIAMAGGIVVGIASILRVSLWIVPIISLLALIVFLIEMWIKYKKDLILTTDPVVYKSP